MKASEAMPRGTLHVAQVLAGKNILFIGATGFVGKVTLSLLLHRYPDIGKIWVLVRSAEGRSPRERFFAEVVASPAFDPVRENWPDQGGLEAFLVEKCGFVNGDVTRPLLGFSQDDLAKIGKLDAIINSAGLVSFTPSLENALRTNVLGPKNVLELARSTGASVVHVSTCFVAGERDGEVWEDDPTDFFPRQAELWDDDFSAEAEIADCLRTIDQIKSQADDRAHVSEFREKAAARLMREGRDPDDAKTLKTAVQRERKSWVNRILTELGMQRAAHWGWTNTYTYSKSLGDQVCAAAKDVRVAIVRPAIVESALRYPFAGWNEGFTTTAPLAFIAHKGHRSYPAHNHCYLDLIPVDMVAAGLVMALSATIEGTNELVYQLGSSDSNPITVPRCVDLLGLHNRAHFTKRAKQGDAFSFFYHVMARMEPIPVSEERFLKTSAPLWKSSALGLAKLLTENRPRWGAPRLAALMEHAESRLQQVATTAKKTEDLFRLFMPFIYQRKYVFRCDHTRALYARLSAQDKKALRWSPESIDWRHYWLEVHLPGLEKWIFANLEEEFRAKPKSVYTYRDLLEMFDTATTLHKSRVALRLVPGSKQGKIDWDRSRRYTYAELQQTANEIAHRLIQCGVKPGENVVLMSENRPEWGMTYFGILKAGGVAVPVDPLLSLEELRVITSAANVRVMVMSNGVAMKFASQAAELPANMTVIPLRTLLDRTQVGSEHHLPPDLPGGERGDQLASLLFTSGTTGSPKGVMLSHRNFASLLSKMSGVFDLDRHDTLLSVLPLHHTFEFSAGLLMPLQKGSQILYLRDPRPDSIQAVLQSGLVTGMIGVPALWQAFERAIFRPFESRSPWLKRAFQLLIDAGRQLRDYTPPKLDYLGLTNLNKALFWPIHRRFGGRLRLLISGGAALPVETQRLFRGVGFHLFEGYGMTESSPVLAVQRPGKKLRLGSVGPALPGVELKIDSPDAGGVGEVLAQGPSVMAGYWNNAAATASTLKGGWLHTGDLGRLDRQGNLYIVGRKKEMILASNGENVYPDEIEELYRDADCIKELCIVGLPIDGGLGETIACLVQPKHPTQIDSELSPAAGRMDVRKQVLDHFSAVSAKLPLSKRVRVIHMTEQELPKTVTRKIKRKEVALNLIELERLKKKVAGARDPSAGDSSASMEWVFDLLAVLTHRPRASFSAASRLADLDLDSLLYAELGAALESEGVMVPEAIDFSLLGTLGDLTKMMKKWGFRKSLKAPSPKSRATHRTPARVPAIIRSLGTSLQDWGQRRIYSDYFDTEVLGRVHIPQNHSFLVAANHASHLDMGLVKYALGDWGPRLVALAAKDYFFDDPIRRLYFENFTNLLPMDRHGSLRESLRLATDAVSAGKVLLIFPEGTRSTSGMIAEFKPSIGYLALGSRIDILPMYLAGTYAALPKGARNFQSKRLCAHVGPLLTYDMLKSQTQGLTRSEAYRAAAHLTQLAVTALAPVGDQNFVSPNRDPNRQLPSLATEPKPSA